MTLINSKKPDAEAVQRLRTLILQEDEKRVANLEDELAKLRFRIDDTDEWLEKLDPVIADSLARKIHDSKEDMAEALAPVMGAAIKHQIEDAKEDMVDALYPVIGRTIRKSIAEAMKTLAQHVNERVDKALSFQLFFKKMKSKMTGVPKGKLVLKDALPFQIHEIFLIHKQTGLLLAHVSRHENSSKADREIISSMLTAIRNFASTAFTRDESHELSEIQYDDLQIYLEDGRNAYLAVVCGGVAPEQFATRLKKLELKIHNQFYRELRTFEGETTPFEASTPLLEKLLNEFQPKGAPKIKKNKPPKEPSKLSWIITTLLFICVVGAGIYFLFGNPLHWFAVSSSQHQFTAVETRQLRQTFVQHLNFEIANLQLISDGRTLELNGTVTSESEKILAGRMLAQLSGADYLINNLHFSSSIQPEFAHFKQKIEQTNLSFAQNSARVTRLDSLRLSALIPLLNTVDFDTLYLHGHSDIQGDEQANTIMSRRRAQAIKDVLVALGMPETQIQTMAWGTQKPIASNNTETGRAQNRRVELKFSR